MPKSIFSAEYDQFREHLRTLREVAGLSQVELAERIGWTQTQISKCERGERRLDLIETRRWCHALGTSFPDFVTELERRLPSPKKLRK